MLMKGYPDTVIITKVENEAEDYLNKNLWETQELIQNTDEENKNSIASPKKQAKSKPKRQKGMLRKIFMAPRNNYRTHFLIAVLGFVISFLFFAAIYNFSGSSRITAGLFREEIEILKTPDSAHTETSLNDSNVDPKILPTKIPGSSQQPVWKLHVKQKNSKIRYTWNKY